MRNPTRKCADDPRACAQPESSFTRDGLLVSFTGKKTKPSPTSRSSCTQCCEIRNQTRLHICLLANLEQENSSPNPIDKPYPKTKLPKLDRSPTHIRLLTPPLKLRTDPPPRHRTTPYHTTMNRTRNCTRPPSIPQLGYNTNYLHGNVLHRYVSNNICHLSYSSHPPPLTPVTDCSSCFGSKLRAQIWLLLYKQGSLSRVPGNNKAGWFQLQINTTYAGNYHTRKRDRIEFHELWRGFMKFESAKEREKEEIACWLAGWRRSLLPPSLHSQFPIAIDQAARRLGRVGARSRVTRDVNEWAHEHMSGARSCSCRWVPPLFTAAAKTRPGKKGEGRVKLLIIPMSTCYYSKSYTV